MSSFKNFWRWYSEKDVVSTLEGMQKRIAFYHDKDIDLLRLGCILPNMASSCIHESTDAFFYPYLDIDKDLLDKNKKDDVGGLSVVLTRKAIVDDTSKS